MVGDGQLAIDVCKNKKFDLILMDIRMPKVNGVEAAKQIKLLCPETIIIANTALIYDFKSLVEGDFDFCLYKPINVKKLEDVFRRFIPGY